MSFNPFKNIIINLRAVGPSAVIIFWLLCVTILGLFGQGELATRSLSALEIAGGMILIALSMKVKEQ